MSTFRAAVSASKATPDELPLVHTSLSQNLLSLAASGKLQPRLCDTLKESLVFFFYGRPAYRSNKGSKAGEPIALCPVGLVFKPRTVSKAVRRLHPCDSGAVAKDYLGPELNSADRTALELDASIELARKVVGLLFETNSRYFTGDAVGTLTLTAGSLEERFYRLLRRDGPADFDDRKSAIEVAVAEPVTLAGQLDFVVLPTAFLAEERIRDAILNEWNCDPVPYPTFKGAAPAEYYSVVRNEIARRFTAASRI